MPLPMPTPASTQTKRQVLGERRVLEAVIHDDEVDALVRGAALRAGDAVAARPRSAPTAARSSASSPTLRRRDASPDRRAAAPSPRRHSRASGSPACRPRPRAIRASASAVGVLPAPPTTKLPTQITGTGGAEARRAGPSARPPTCAIDLRHRPEHQRGGARLRAATRIAAPTSRSVAAAATGGRASAPR